MDKINILGSKINVTNIKDLGDKVEKLILSKKTHYICVSNVHTIITGVKDERFKKITNNASLAVPDGMPLVWIGKHRGYKDMEKCSGPDIMTHLFKLSEEKGYTNYFYGGTEDNIKILGNELHAKYPKLKILGMYSPPFRELTKEEDDNIIKKINELKPNILWIGLGAPKQEVWMYQHFEKLSGSVIFGVGAAFNFHSGTLKRAPIWMQKTGLEWLYRLFKEPKRLWKRYLITNSLFIFYLFFLRKKIENENMK